MKKLYPLFCSLVLVLFISGPLYAQERTVLFTNSTSGPIQALAKIILDPRSEEIPVDQLPLPRRYFVRISERSSVLSDDNKISDKALLTGPARPFVFLATPEGFFGKSLLEIYADIGYEAEDIIRRQRNKEMVVVLFRYPDHITLTEVKNGRLGSDWRSRIYPTTWDNIFSLFTQLVQDERSQACKKTDGPSKNICLPKKDRAFVLRFPLSGKRHVKTEKYAVLQANGGSRWAYRKLLEDNLSLFEHFRGDGRTENELLDFRDSKSQPRLFEVVGPNMKISELPEVVVIDLGKLTIETVIRPVAVVERR